MPRPGRKNLSVLEKVFDVAYARYKKDYPDEKIGFTQYISDYILMNIEKDQLLSKYAPNIHKIGITDNVLFLKDTKKNKIVEIRMNKGKLESSDEDPIYTNYAWALPELAKLKQ